MKKWVVAVSVVLGAVVLFTASKYHLVYGSDISGIKIQKKLSPSLSETIVNFDAVGGMPMLVARAQYPLFTEALMRSAKGAQGPSGSECRKIYAGMQYPQAEVLCGAPSIIGNSSDGSQTYYWPGGVSATVHNNVIKSVRM